MSSDDIAISVRNLTKTYRLFGHPGDRVKQFLSLGLKQYHREFTALSDVSFDVKKGEVVGIIGRNGSGKSTLLQLICGILKPTAGSVTVNGRISALLELGAGFNPEFTGRENVFFQGALMGFTRAQMEARFDDIAEFADIGEFIDQPVRTYSSGMYVRLAFATMIHVDADILVIDEAIAVGDASFRARCFRRLGELRANGCSILFVTHAMEQVTRFCSRALLLNNGKSVLRSEPFAVVDECLRLQGLTLESLEASVVEAGDYIQNGAHIENVRLVEAERYNDTECLRSGQEYRCLFRARIYDCADNVRGAFLIRSAEGFKVGGAMTGYAGSLTDGTTVDMNMVFSCRLNSGNYFLSVALFASEGGVEYALHAIRNAIHFKVTRNNVSALL